MEKDRLNIHLILEGCRKHNRLSQRKLYELYYGYAMNICLRYAGNKEEAREMLNDGFLNPAYPFKGWLRKVLINAAVDYYRKYRKLRIQTEDCEMEELTGEVVVEQELEVDVLPLIQQLPPAYRMVFNLYVMEGLKHHEIADKLDISVGSSKSNLARAKDKLRRLLQEKAKRRSN
jgi:RNA polymerase sigma factor (sigma-70 family)